MRVYIDCDGVLADFNKGACELHGLDPAQSKSWLFYREQGLTDEEFWAPILRSGPAFTAYLERLPWAERLIKVCRRHSSPFWGIAALTAPWASSGAWGARVEWLREMGFDFNEIILCPGKLKSALAHTKQGPQILIDDNDGNIDSWCAAGGTGLLWPQPWNALADKAHLLHEAQDRLLDALARALRLRGRYGIQPDRHRWCSTV
jgi:hypothetical protein